MQFLYGEAFAPAALTIQLMCPLILIKGFGGLFCYQLVYSTKSEKISLPAAASASIINVITNAALIPSLLQNGAVVASVAAGGANGYDSAVRLCTCDDFAAAPAVAHAV